MYKWTYWIIVNKMRHTNGGTTMEIPVKLEVFEGPLDLLLKLIDKNKINIYDIPIVTITEQYLDYVRTMDKENMDLMSEFLVMASVLINIKAKMLLPKETNINDEDEDVDPRTELVMRLLEYKKYKYTAIQLADKEVGASRVLYKGESIPDEIKDYQYVIEPQDVLGDITLAAMYKIYKSVIKRQEEKIDPIRSKFNKVEVREISIEDRMDYIDSFRSKYKYISFRELLESRHSRYDVIITFMSVLELMKTSKIYITQEDTFGEINIEFI